MRCRLRVAPAQPIPTWPLVGCGGRSGTVRMPDSVCGSGGTTPHRTGDGNRNPCDDPHRVSGTDGSDDSPGGSGSRTRGGNLGPGLVRGCAGAAAPIPGPIRRQPVWVAASGLGRALSDPGKTPLEPFPIPLINGSHLRSLKGYEGLEAIVFAGSRFYLAVEGRSQGRMLGYLIPERSWETWTDWNWTWQTPFFCSRRHH